MQSPSWQHVSEQPPRGVIAVKMPGHVTCHLNGAAVIITDLYRGLGGAGKRSSDLTDTFAWLASLSGSLPTICCNNYLWGSPCNNINICKLCCSTPAVFRAWFKSVYGKQMAAQLQNASNEKALRVELVRKQNYSLIGRNKDVNLRTYMMTWTWWARHPSLAYVVLPSPVWK